LPKPSLSSPIAESIWTKLREQIERVEHLIGLIPQDKIAWDPKLPHTSTDLGHLLGHLLDCLAGFYAVFVAAFPEECAHLEDLRLLPVNHFCPPEEALGRIHEYARHLETAFTVCSDSDLARTIPSVFAPEGESLTTLLLGNLEHIISHKYQLFLYLKLLGVLVGSRDLYHWRGASETSDAL